MTELAVPDFSAWNQKIYQRLKVALSLGLRRQIFVAICDEIGERNRFSTCLHRDLVVPKRDRHPIAPSEEQPNLYPHFVSLDLNLSHPHLINQILGWITVHPPPLIHTGSVPSKRRKSLPSFEILGVELLTHQPAQVQYLFLKYLQAIPLELEMVEFSFLIWLSRPWVHTIQQSAPNFWRCCTGIFPFQENLAVEPENFVPENSETKVSKKVLENQLLTGSDSSPLVWNGIASAIPFSLNQEIRPSNSIRLTFPKNQPDQQESSSIWGISPLQLKSVAALDADQIPVVSSNITRQFNSTKFLAENLSNRTQANLANLTSKTSTEAPTETLPVISQVLLPDSPIVSPCPATSLTGIKEYIDRLHRESSPPTALLTAYRTLGDFWRDRIEAGEDSIDNLLHAIRAYEQVLVFLEPDSTLWADILNDLGNLYWMLSRIAGNSDQIIAYLDQGIQAYQSALRNLDPQTAAAAYVRLQSNLGSAAVDLAHYRNPTENFRKSIHSFEQALLYRPVEHEDDRTQDAAIHNNLGTAYWHLAQYQTPSEHLKQAIAAYQQALELYQQEPDYLNYAMVQNNLGTAYWNLAQYEETEELLWQAIDHYSLALKYRTPEVVPSASAATFNNLGIAFWHLANHYKSQMEIRLKFLEKAIEAYEKTLNIASNLPNHILLTFDLFTTHSNLGIAHYQIATEANSTLADATKSSHLEAALFQHVQAYMGWKQKPEFHENALKYLVQTIRAFYQLFSLPGQNLALSKIPAQLLPEILPKL